MNSALQLHCIPGFAAIRPIYDFLIRKPRECRAAPSELFDVATRHKESLAGQKILWPVGLPFCRRPCSTKHAERAKIRLWARAFRLPAV